MVRSYCLIQQFFKSKLRHKYFLSGVKQVRHYRGLDFCAVLCGKNVPKEKYTWIESGLSVYFVDFVAKVIHNFPNTFLTFEALSRKNYLKTQLSLLFSFIINKKT